MADPDAGVNEDTRTSEGQAAANTDRELWRKGDGDGNGMSYYEPSIHVTQDGLIGINVGGLVIQKPVEEWHALAAAPAPTDTGERDEATIREALDLGLQAWRSTPVREKFHAAFDALRRLAAASSDTPEQDSGMLASSLSGEHDASAGASEDVSK